MKRFFSILLLLFCVFSSKSQTWCAPGAQWYYRVYVPMLNNYQDGYLKLDVASTNTVGGIAYHSISMFYYGHQFTQYSATVAVSRGTIHTYEQNKVIYASMYGGQYDTIANFNANIGDKWRMTRDQAGNTPTNCITPYITVKDTGHVTINTQNLKRLVLHSSKNNYTDTVIEKIGSIVGFMFAYYTCESDIWSTGYFVCYSDNNFPLYKNAGYNLPCDYSLWSTVGTKEFNLKDSKFKVFPNPVNEELFLEFENAGELGIIISDISGKEILKTKIKQSGKITISDLESGLYFVNLFESGKLIATEKMIKN